MSENSKNNGLRNRIAVFVRDRENPFLFPQFRESGEEGWFEFGDDLGLAYVGTECIGRFPIENVVAVLNQPYLFIAGELRPEVVR